MTLEIQVGMVPVGIKLKSKLKVDGKNLYNNQIGNANKIAISNNLKGLIVLKINSKKEEGSIFLLP
ncbi:hypothetical protein [Desulfosporosinus sp. FKB]|uniref:hypothetical protein n=1 Tax=Desulfosporosinus sp. FKB TaxID=1969835 RepID=UPI000B49A973|nr:hypothetical protein [Desulfosporosinus sp. FKB]